ISVCPVATVQAPLEGVWAELTNPASYGAWWRARTERIEPPGPLAPGQTVYASAGALGVRLPVTLHVEGGEPARHAVGLRAEFPLGIVVANHLVCQAIDAGTTRLSFG